MIKKLFIIPALFITLCAFQQGFFHQTLGSIAEIDFPSKPETMDTLGQQVYHLTDSSYFYLVAIKDMTADVGTNLKPSEIDEVYTGFIEGVLKASN